MERQLCNRAERFSSHQRWCGHRPEARVINLLPIDTPFRLTEDMSTDARNQVELSAVLWAASEGGFTALNPETGTVSEGETKSEALANLTEATELYLEEFPLPDRQMPVITTIRIADVT